MPLMLPALRTHLHAVLTYGEDLTAATDAQNRILQEMEKAIESAGSAKALAPEGPSRLLAAQQVAARQAAALERVQCRLREARRCIREQRETLAELRTALRKTRDLCQQLRQE
jgi:hypothetical protein